MSEKNTEEELRPRPVVRGEGRDEEEQLLAPLKAGWLEAGRELVVRLNEVGRNKSIVADLLAGLTVAAVALPLNVALAVASGLPASAGLIAGAIGGGIAAIFGGQTLQATGPAAALSVMVLAIASKFGATGVAAATVIIGITQLLLAAMLAGRLARFVPEAVLAGFTTGVGLKILDQQIPELLGFQMLEKDYKFVDMAAMMHHPAWLHHVSWQSVVCGLFVAFLVTTTKQYKRFPAAIVGIAVVTFISSYLSWELERVGALPSSLPRPSLPLVPDEQWLDLIVAAIPLALLASIESLLSGRAVDRMTGTTRPFNPNLELFGQGLANIGVGAMSGLPVTGVIVRSGVNVQSGARTKLAALTHAVMLLVAVLFLSKTIAIVPEAALAGLLLVIGVRLIELSHFVHLVRKEKLEALAFAVTAAGTLSGHLISGLVLGFIVHALHHKLYGRSAADLEAREAEHASGLRAVVGRTAALARRPQHDLIGPHGHAFIPNVRGETQMKSSAYVHPKSSVIGRVVLGDNVHIAATASVRADEGTPFFIGPSSNVQDGVVIHALQNRHVRVAGEDWAVYVGRNVSIAHDALVHGPCYIGDDTFIGFKAVVHDSVVGAGCFIGIGAVVVGVEVPDGRFVPHGAIVDSADAVDALGPTNETQQHFNEEVVEVNRGLAAAYHAVASHSASRPAGRQIAPASRPSWNEAWSRSVDKNRF